MNRDFADEKFVNILLNYFAFMTLCSKTETQIKIFWCGREGHDWQFLVVEIITAFAPLNLTQGYQRKSLDSTFFSKNDAP